MNGIFVAITVADGYLLHGCAVAPIEQRLDECLDAPPREQAPLPASGLLSILFAIRHRPLDQALWRRPPLAVGGVYRTLPAARTCTRRTPIPARTWSGN